MRVSVDADHCQGHTMCKMAAPAVFQLDDVDGHAYVPVDEVPMEQQERVRQAVASCPERAISLEA